MATGSDQPRKRSGRPPKNPGSGRRINAMFRMNEAMRDRLMAAADQSGRSMSEEIERRIERSFEDVDLLLSYFGSSETLKLAQAISYLASAAENKSGKKWTEDPVTKGNLAGAIARFYSLYFYEHNEEDSKSYATSLESMGVGHSIAEMTAEYYGFRSKAREEWEAFLATPEGRSALDRATAASRVSTS